MRDLGIEADGWNAARRGPELQDGECGGWDAQPAIRPLGHTMRQQPADGRRSEDRNGSRVRHRRRDGAKAHPGGNAQVPDKAGELRGELVPAKVGLWSREHQQVALTKSRGAEGELRPPERL